jgi:ADP-ribosyl-[dinitrogen reductase] hydrolase
LISPQQPIFSDNNGMEQVTDRLRGIAVGAAIGDALGMPLEFHPPNPVYNLVTEMIRGPLPAGTFTDDTEMALALAESLLLTSPLDTRDLAARFTAWYQSGPDDIGIHTKQVLQLIARGTPWEEASRKIQESEPDSAANGSVMRCWPGAVVRWNSPALLVAESRLQSEITHPHPDCVNACVLVNLILSDLVRRSPGSNSDAALRQAIANAVEQVDLGADFRLVIDLAPVRSRDNLRNTGWVRHTVESALWAVLTTRSFEEALVQAVNLGWDADTTGCVTGAIAGALYGLEGIPSRWREVVHGEYPIRSGKLWFQKDFIELADQLALAGQRPL